MPGIFPVLRLIAYLLILSGGLAQAAGPGSVHCAAILGSRSDTIYAYRDIHESLYADERVKNDRVLGEPVLPFTNGVTANTRLRLNSLNKGKSGQVIKDYRVENSGVCEGDLRLLRLLGRLLKGESKNGFAVTTARRDWTLHPLQCLRLITGFVPGRTLHDLLTDPEVPQELSQRLQEIYLAKLDHLEYRLQVRGWVGRSLIRKEPQTRYFADRQLDPLPILIGDIRNWWPLSWDNLIIKTDNVIVDPYDPNKMTIIDPY